jgi:RAT1-interacting protein
MPTTWDATSRDYIEGREDQIVNNKAQYCSVVRTGIGRTTLVLGGEVDAVWDAKPEPPDPRINWVELKTSVDPRSERDLQAFERKLMKFWIQSFLLGVPKIIVGFRDQNGILARIEEMDTAKIPGAVKKRGHGTWAGNMCINFAAAFLERKLPPSSKLLSPALLKIFGPVVLHRWILSRAVQHGGETLAGAQFLKLTKPT